MFISRQESFICEKCGFEVEVLKHGTCRNHCPKCLYSKHVDSDVPGDRAASCQGLMRSIGVEQDSKMGFVIIHKCETCGIERKNKAAPDDVLFDD